MLGKPLLHQLLPLWIHWHICRPPLITYPPVLFWFQHTTEFVYLIAKLLWDRWRFRWLTGCQVLPIFCQNLWKLQITWTCWILMSLWARMELSNGNRWSSRLIAGVVWAPVAWAPEETARRLPIWPPRLPFRWSRLLTTPATMANQPGGSWRLATPAKNDQKSQSWY